MYAVAVDEVHGFMYWSDSNTVGKAKLDGSDQRDIHHIPGKSICAADEMLCHYGFIFV